MTNRHIALALSLALPACTFDVPAGAADENTAEITEFANFGRVFHARPGYDR